MPARLGSTPESEPADRHSRDVFRFVAEYCLGLESIERARALRSSLAQLLTLASDHASLTPKDRQKLTGQTLELLDFLESLQEASLLYRTHTERSAN